MKVKRRYCKGCGHYVAAQRFGQVAGCLDVILFFMTGGLSLVLKLMLWSLIYPWKCPNCGKKV